MFFTRTHPWLLLQCTWGRRFWNGSPLWNPSYTCSASCSPVSTWPWTCSWWRPALVLRRFPAPEWKPVALAWRWLIISMTFLTCYCLASAQKFLSDLPIIHKLYSCARPGPSPMLHVSEMMVDRPNPMLLLSVMMVGGTKHTRRITQPWLWGKHLFWLQGPCSWVKPFPTSLTVEASQVPPWPSPWEPARLLSLVFFQIL